MKCAATFLALVCLFRLGSALNSWQLPDPADLKSAINADLDMDWLAFKKSYNRTYNSNIQEMERRIYWEDSIKFIQDHNIRFDRGEETYTVGENDFADMGDDEFRRMYLSGLIIPTELAQKQEEDVVDDDDEIDEDPPLMVDWRTRGVVSPVKNQGRCGACWAFSALGSLEAAVKIKTEWTVHLSEQELLDCSYLDYGNYGCRGGLMTNAFKYIEETGGVDTEGCYRYRAKRSSQCFRKSLCAVAPIKRHRNTRRGSERNLALTVAHIGPVSVGVDADSRGFKYYKRGLYYNRSCNKWALNHAMVNVGYGTSVHGNYWIMKNSWGRTWGDHGYIFMAKDKGDTCGITRQASYPVL